MTFFHQLGFKEVRVLVISLLLVLWSDNHVVKVESTSTTTTPNVHGRRNNRNSHTADFQQSAARIMNQSITNPISIQKTSNNNNNRRHLQSTNSAIMKKTQPIRIHFFTDPIEDAIAKSTNANHKKGGQLVLDTILPAIEEEFQNTISVEPVDRLDVPKDICDGIYSQYIPDNYMVNDADIVIIVSSLTTVVDSDGNEFEWCSLSEDLTTLAAAISCGQHQSSMRPIIGLMNVCLAATANQSTSNMEEILSHELLHVLVVSEYLFPFYRNPVTGYGMVSNPRIAQRINCVNGKDPINFYTFSPSTLAYRTETIKYNFSRVKRGYYEITSPTVRQVVRNQFDCQSLTGARLENQPTNPNSCIGSHFDERFFQYNIMSALYDSTSVHFTPLTLALLEDSGWYKVDFTKAENAPFGIHSGCDFATKDCIIRDSIPAHSEGNFCADDASDGIFRCDPGHNFRGICDLYDYRLYQTTLDKPGREYFTNTFKGPIATVHADWCPTVYKYSDASAECHNPDAEAIDGFEVFGGNSKCMNVEVNGSSKALCVESSCDNEGKQYIFDVNGVSYTCGFGEDGKRIQVDGPKAQSYEFICPKLAQVCPDMFCPSMCSGKGICDWNAAPYPACNCYDESDTSVGCYNSPPNDPNMAYTSSPSYLLILLTAISVSLYAF